MFFGIYMITVADPQILWNDGFYPLVDVEIPDDSFWKPQLPGGAQRPQPRRRPRLRPLRRPARPDEPRPAQRGRLLLLAALHVLRHVRRGRPQGRVVPALLDRLRRHPRPADRRRPGRPLAVALLRQHPLRVPRVATTRCGSSAGRRSPDTGGAGAAPRRQRRRRRLPLPRAGHHRDPRRPLADLPVGRQRRRRRAPAAASGSTAPTARREVLAEQGARRAGRGRATSCTSSPGAAAAGATRWRATPSWSASRCAAGSSAPRAPGATASSATRRARVDAGGDRGPARASCAPTGRTELPTFDMGPPLETILARRSRRPGCPARPSAPIAGDDELATTTPPPASARALELGQPPAPCSRRPGRAYFDPASRALHGQRRVPRVARARVLAAARDAGVPVIHTRVELRGRAASTAGSSSARSRRWGTSSATAPLGELMPEVAPLPTRSSSPSSTPARSSAPRWPSTLTAARHRHRSSSSASAPAAASARRAVDAIQHGFVPLVVRDAVGDRDPEPHEANLFDLQAKYAEVVDEADREWPTWEARRERDHRRDRRGRAPRRAAERGHAAVHRGQAGAHRAGGRGRRAPDRGDQLRQPRPGAADGRRRGGDGRAAAPPAACATPAGDEPRAASTARSPPVSTRSTSSWSPPTTSASGTRACPRRRRSRPSRRLVAGRAAPVLQSR